ncbi:MAG: hypothetical protein ABS949_06665 [Solibacillus sp.]
MKKILLTYFDAYQRPFIDLLQKNTTEAIHVINLQNFSQTKNYSTYMEQNFKYNYESWLHFAPVEQEQYFSDIQLQHWGKAQFEQIDSAYLILGFLTTNELLRYGASCIFIGNVVGVTGNGPFTNSVFSSSLQSFVKGSSKQLPIKSYCLLLKDDFWQQQQDVQDVITMIHFLRSLRGKLLEGQSFILDGGDHIA